MVFPKWDKSWYSIWADSNLSRMSYSEGETIRTPFEVYSRKRSKEDRRICLLFSTPGTDRPYLPIDASHQTILSAFSWKDNCPRSLGKAYRLMFYGSTFQG